MPRSATVIESRPHELTADGTLRAERVLLKPLTGVRAVAATWVVIGHFTPHIIKLFPMFRVFEPLTTSGFLGVDLFFVLSGFILTHNYLSEFSGSFSPRQYRRFLWLRLARMYPVHLFSLLVLLLGVIVGSQLHFHFNMPERLGPVDFVRNVFLIHAWGFAGDTSWNGPAWSISAEWFAYLLCPFVILMIARLRSVWACIFGAGLMYAALLTIYGLRGYSFDSLDNDLALVRVITQFVAGCLIYRVYKSGWQPPIRWEWVSLLMVCAVLAYAINFPPDRLISLAPAPLMGVLVLSLAQERSGLGLSRLLGSRSMVFWGEASYSLYMTHDIVRMTVGKLLNVDRFASRGLLTRAGALAALAVAVFGAAVATFLFVETPARRFMRSLIGKAKPVEDPARTNPIIAAAIPDLPEGHWVPEN